MKSNSLFTHQDHVVIIKQAKYCFTQSYAMIWCKRLGQSVSLYCMFMFIQTHSPTSACARSVACTVLSDDGVARLWNHLKEQVGLDTETHDEKQPEKDAISELSDHPPLRLRATEVECLECRWYLTSTR